MSVASATKNEIKTILIVDDEEGIRRTLSQVLEDEGYNVLVASDGPEALRLMSSLRPSLIILDIWMPGMDGMETLKEVKFISPETPVLMMSGHATISTAVEATHLGAVDFIEKPFDLDKVLKRVESIVQFEHFIPSDNLISEDIRQSKPKSSNIHLQKLVINHKGLKGKSRTQRTLRASTIMYGQGLHTGAKSGLVLEPLPPNSGIHFVGVSGGAAVPANVKYVRSTGFATTLSFGSTSIGTIEHVLSAIHACGISNLLIKCNGEIPVMDGSALPFIELLCESGFEDQKGNWYEIAIDRTIRIGDDKEWIQIEPAENFSIDYTLSYPEPIGVQRYVYNFDSIESYTKEIAPARTFGFLKDIGYLQEKGLAQGGRFDNFILVGESGPLNASLRFPDEFVRHKILDAIGDLFLLGRPLRGKVTACMTGHSDNIALLKHIAELL
jgi:UDP-3-O-[3-hydroxymyristoyl] N-acetylglucosamine deacetylase